MYSINDYAYNGLLYLNNIMRLPPKNRSKYAHQMAFTVYHRWTNSLTSLYRPPSSVFLLRNSTHVTKRLNTSMPATASSQHSLTTQSIPKATSKRYKPSSLLLNAATHVFSLIFQHLDQLTKSSQGVHLKSPERTVSLCYGTQKLFIQPRKSLENGRRQVVFTILATRFVHYPAKISLINRGIIYAA